MYKKILIIIAFVVLNCLPFNSANQAYALNPKVKVLLSTGSYGMIGGALLGASSLAFDASPRSVAQGASIGLWTGLLFGSYIILSHMFKLSQEDSAADVPYGGSSPYGDDAYGTDNGAGSGANSSEVEVDGAGNPLERWNPYQELNNYRQEQSWTTMPTTSYRPLFYLNVINISF